MKSPAHPQVTMEPVELEPGLHAFQCPVSHGHYIPAGSYWAWMNQQEKRLPQLPPSATTAQPMESTGLRICPETGTVMTRYRVGHGFAFSIDRSAAGGIWLDAGEWVALRERQFHDELHRVFTAPWQAEVRSAAQDRQLDEHFAARLGLELHEKLSALRVELLEKGLTSTAVAFLSAELRG